MVFEASMAMMAKTLVEKTLMETTLVLAIPIPPIMHTSQATLILMSHVPASHSHQQRRLLCRRIMQ